jgi:hypothetical protein
MKMNNKTILETLKLQPLTEEEKQRRHILGRWYGPIATCNEGTRNGRRYNRELWEKALNDELFHEKIANKCLFLELGHPQDREETDMSKVCACIPEMPRIIDGDLCACVDILDTPNGRILKTLCDYGFIPGVSSRGSGDIMPNNDVDPDTFFLETFDCVAIPAVKKARLTMCESLDSEGLKLRKALTESFNNASEEDKVIMKETFDNLNIDIDSEIADEPKKVLTADDIPWDPDAEEADMLVEDAEDSEDVEVAEEPAVDADEAADGTEASDEESEDETTEEPEEETESKEEAIEEDDAPGAPDLETVSDAVELLQEYDDDMPVEFEPVVIDGKEYEVKTLDHFVDDTDEENPVLVIGVNCESTEEASEITDDIESEIEDEETSEEAFEETENDVESADDNGDEEVMESLKEMIRQKEALEAEVNELRKAKTVGDAKEQELQEKLARYRKAFKQTSAEAAKVPELQSKVTGLNEQLTQSKNTIKRLTEKVNNARQLKESIEANKSSEKRLNESVSRLTEANKTLEAKLEGQTKQYVKKLQERTDLAKSYKARFLETLNKYIESKANMLSVRPSEITSRLNENYTLADVDAVCDQIMDTAVPFSRLPFGGRAKTSARISESVSKQTAGYEEDDLSDLYELAGLKK